MTPAAPDTPFSIGSNAGDLMHMLLRTLARGRDTALAQDPGEAIGMPPPGASPSGMAPQAAMLPAMPPPPTHRGGFGGLKRKHPARGGHDTGGKGSGAGGVPGASMPHGAHF